MPKPNASSRFLMSPGLIPDAAIRIRTSPEAGIGSGISPTVRTSRAGPCFSYQAAFIESPHFRQLKHRRNKILSYRKSWKQRGHHINYKILEDSYGSRNVAIAQMDQ